MKNIKGAKEQRKMGLIVRQMFVCFLRHRLHITYLPPFPTPLPKHCISLCINPTLSYHRWVSSAGTQLAHSCMVVALFCPSVQF